MNETLSERFKYLRQIRAQATQDDFAAVMQTKRSRVADIERGKVRELKASEAVMLAKHFNIDGWWLMTGEGEAEAPQLSITSEGMNFENGIIPHESLTEIAVERLLESIGDVDFTLSKVETNRFEPIIPQGSSLLLEKNDLYRDGDLLLIETVTGLYIKQYHIDLGQKEGEIVQGSHNEQRIPLADLEAGGAIVKGRVAGYLKMFYVE